MRKILATTITVALMAVATVAATPASAGNFNLTNVDELFRELVDLGQYPKEKSDTVTVLEKIGHFLDEIARLVTEIADCTRQKRCGMVFVSSVLDAILGQHCL